MISEEELVRKKWSEILKFLERANDKAMTSPRRRAELHSDVLAELTSALRDALLGHPPSVWEPKPHGFPERVEIYTERRRDLGVAHVLAAHSGLIDDPEPNKTVRKVFGVSRQRVQQWVLEEKKEPGWATLVVQDALAAGEKSSVSLMLDIRFWRDTNLIALFPK